MCFSLSKAYRSFLSLLLVFFLLGVQHEPSFSKTGDEQNNLNLRKAHLFSILACVTWWSHDAVGYHPAMCLYLENISGHPLTNTNGDSRSAEEIPFQGRFTDLRNAGVTVAREYIRGPIPSHARFPLILRGPQSYDLPIDSSLWPSIECKAMCRIEDAEPEELFLGHLAHMTMSDEDAQALLIAQAGRNPLLIKDKGTDSAMPTTIAPHNRPSKHLITSALKSTAPSKPLASAKNEKDQNNAETDLAKTPLPSVVPSIGNDFYAFEKLYGTASEFQASANNYDLTWAHYKCHGALSDAYAGSRNSNKADVIILSLPSNKSLNDKSILLLGKQLAGCRKSDPITPFAHSVKYTAGGRTEFMTTAIRECRIISFKIGGDTILAVSRLPGNIETSLSSYSKRVRFLDFLDLFKTETD